MLLYDIRNWRPQHLGNTRHNMADFIHTSIFYIEFFIVNTNKGLTC